MWEISNSLQLLSLFRSIIFGFIIFLIYDILRSITISFKFSDINIFITDVLYCVLLMPFVFCFLIVTTNGELRGYIFIGLIIGLLFWKYTLSRLYFPLLVKLNVIIYKGSTWIYRGIFSIFSSLYLYFCKFFKNCLNLFKKMLIYFKKLLKKQ